MRTLLEMARRCLQAKDGIRYSPSSVIRHPSSVIRHPSSVIRHPSSVIRHPSSVIRHPSSVIRRKGRHERPSGPNCVSRDRLPRLDSPGRPDARTGRARARRLSLLLPVVALLLGALVPFAPAPAEAQTVTLVTNFGQTKLTGTRFTGDNSLAQGFTTGSNSGGYTLTSIEAISRGGGTAVQAATVRAELWSATTGGAPDSKIADLTIPTGAVAANATMSFGAPAGTTLTANTTYYFVIYTVGAFNLALESTSAHAEDSGGLSGWTIADAIRFQRNDSPSGSTWTTDSQGAIALIRVKGAAKQDTTNANLSALTASTHTSATGTFTSLTLTPSTFAATTTSYTATVGNARTHLKLTPTVAATGATVKVGKQGTTLATVTSGQPSGAIPLSVGANAITVEVTAADGTTKKTYTVTVTRVPTGTVWQAILTPQDLGAGLGLGCTITFPSGANRCDVETTLTDDDFSVGSNSHTIDGIQSSGGTLVLTFSVASAATYQSSLSSLNFCVGSTALAFSNSSASGGVNVRQWTSTGLTWTANTPVSLSIGTSCAQQTPTQSTDATLSGLTATQATSASGPFSALSIGAFNSGTTTYAASVANSITHVKLRPTVNDSNATVKVGKGTSLATVTSGQPSAAIALDVGANALKVEVTAQDGTKQTYTVTVTRAQAQTQAPAPVVPTGPGKSVWSATLTAQNVVPSVVVGCTGSGSSSCALTSVLTDDDFSLFGKTFTITQIQQTSAGALDIGFDQAISTQTARRLTLHVGDREFPLTEAAYSSGNTTATWASTGLTWSASQQVPLRLTLGPRWSGVAFEGGGLLPGPTGGQELLVAEDGSATFGVKLTRAPTANVTIRLYKFAPAAIHGNADAVTFSPKELTFTPANYGTAQTVTVTGVPDGNSDHEHLYINAASSSTDAHYALQGGHEALFVTVTDGAGAVKVGLSRGAARESGDGTATNAPVTVWLNRASTSQVRVTYATAPDPDAPADKRATAGSDYTHVSGTLVFSPGQTRKTVQVPILDDQTEDSGESFRFVLSNVQGATLEEGYGHVTMVILNDEAQIDGLSVEGAPGAGGPWAKLDIGAFAPETAEYSATVPHGTTHARVTPETGDEDLLLWAGSGTGLASVRSGQAGSTVALAVGENVLMVQTRAATGKRQTYRVTVTRQARPGVAVSLSATPNPVGEGSAVTVRATLARALAEAVTVPLRTTRGTSEAGDHGSLASIAIPAGFTSATGTVPTVEDGDGDDETFTVALDANNLPSALTAGTASSVRVTITDSGRQTLDPLTARLRGAVAEHDGETPFMVELALSESLDSGSRWPSAASFKVKGGSVASVRRFRPYLYQVHVQPKSWRDVTVTLAGGRACSEEGAICTADGRSVSNTSTMTVGGPVRIRVEGARAKEGKDASLDFAVTLNRAAAHEVSVDYATEDDTATAGSDYTATSGTLTFAAGETAKTVSVPVLDDAVDEGKEVMRLLLSNPKGAYLRNVHTRARGIITNDDPLQRMWLARFGRAAAGHVAGAIDGRLSGGGAAGVVLGGHSLTGGAEREALESRLAEALMKEREVRFGRGEEAPASSVREVAMSDLLLASSFHMASAEKVDAGSRWSLWGRGARSSFEGAEGDLSLDGDVTTATVGFDYERARWLVGVALSRSSGDGSYKAGGACDTGCAGEVESTLTGVYPYARYRVSGTFSLWGAVGHGQGEMTLTPGGSSPVEADVAMGMAAAGARGVVLPAREAGGFELALRADVLVTNTRSDAAAGLAETEAETSRVRLVLEGSRSFRLGEGLLTPSLEIGFRNDSGDAETGGGVEAGGSVRWTSGALTTEVRARSLLSHGESGYEEWGVSASVAYAPGSGGRGLTLRAGSSWGASAGGAERLWSQAAGLSPAGGFEPGAAGFEAEAAWGLDAPRGLLTPYTGVAVSGNGEIWRAGARWKPGAATEVSLEASLTEQAGGGRPEGGLLLRGSKRW